MQRKFLDVNYNPIKLNHHVSLPHRLDFSSCVLPTAIREECAQELALAKADQLNEKKKDTSGPKQQNAMVNETTKYNYKTTFFLFGNV
ncbi:hypothetical protein FACS189472_10550 [Alphaproteobacteria bacterium]|nr:hypothetical protein FACS189472_10550 [Alphaproteobacteria bacterium]